MRKGFLNSPQCCVMLPPLSALGSAPIVSGQLAALGFKSKNPAAPAVEARAEEVWGR